MYLDNSRIAQNNDEPDEPDYTWFWLVAAIVVLYCMFNG